MKALFALLLIIVSIKETLAAVPARGTILCREDNCSYEERTVEKITKNETSSASVDAPKDITTPKEKTFKKDPPNNIKKESYTTNLPSYYKNITRKGNNSTEVVFVTKNTNPKLHCIKIGDILEALVEQSIKASPATINPIRAILLSGQLRGAILIGEAKLEQELKRILLSFYKLRINNETYSIQATGLSLNGQTGIEGEYHSNTGKFFLAELGAGVTAAIVDNTIERTQNNQGNWVTEPLISNSAKVGASTALSRTAEHMAEKVRSAPEWTEIPGYQRIKIIITEEPKEETL